MTEKEAIQQLEKPHTTASLIEDFRNLGVEEGMVLIVHSSLSSLGWVCGGAVAVVTALMKAVGERGTLIMPAQSADNSDPSEWENPPVPESWWQIIRDEMPVYDPGVTPSRGMGMIADVFRSFPGVSRSSHPMYSFAAWGKHADYILSEQPLEEGFGPRSPLAKIYELEGSVLLLGVTHESNTSLHFAEHSIGNREKAKKGAALMEDGSRVWKVYEEILYDSDPFEELGKEFEGIHTIKTSMIGKADCKLLDQRAVVDFAREWLQNNNEKKGMENK
ncbi:AAC(3) family N-acetyltransferase [Rossellomorea vietnamensis]|uniref:Aminoglycoside N(3)-acetyltransferase n=1 Tax=Rossellomorea vietnamensis TaxID=218284 RepID=A0A5D4MAI0_9BACI|nr:AAC(3) family N-acetyltransferase [Rossellomorea vietnamensis]TYR98702.1 AAC(3) family N-acetyltransferase [Rossellomorea vietnamensis]